MNTSFWRMMIEEMKKEIAASRKRQKMGGADREKIKEGIKNLRRTVRSLEREFPELRALSKPPGVCIRSFAEFLFSRRTFEHILEPAILDLREEYFGALQSGRTWKARWVRVRGYWSFWSAVAAQAPLSAIKVIYKIWKAIP